MSETALEKRSELALVVALADLRAMAEAAAKSGLFPALKTTESIMVLMLLCQSEGLHPIVALRRFDIVQGRPALKTDAMLGEFQGRGGIIDWLENTIEKCSATFVAPGLAKPITVTWTMEDARRAGLAGKSGPWQQYPRQMLRARVISEGIRMAMPAIVAGIYSPEEVTDFAPARVVEVLPSPKAPAEPKRLQVIVESSDSPTAIAVPAAVGPPAISAADADAPIGAAPAPDAITGPQVKKLQAAVGKLLPRWEGEEAMDHRARRLAWLCWAIGRDVKSTTELSNTEASMAIKRAEAGEKSEEVEDAEIRAFHELIDDGAK